MLEPGPTLELVGLKGGNVLLDLGCGEGHFSIAASRIVGRYGHVYALDIDARSLEVLRREINEKGLRNVEAICADASMGIPLGNDTVDVCVMVNVLHGFVANGETNDVMREVVRVVKPGGALGIVDFKKVEGAHGPPMHVRLAPGRVQEIVTDLHFRKKELHDIGPGHYAIIFKRS